MAAIPERMNMYAAMKVAELRELLQNRGLPTNGKKSELVERLILAETSPSDADGDHVATSSSLTSSTSVSSPTVMSSLNDHVSSISATSMESSPLSLSTGDNISSERSDITEIKKMTEEERMSMRKAKFGAVTDEEKKAERLKRFGATNEEEKMKLRAMRFGGAIEGFSVDKDEVEKRKRRAERFGVVDDEEKKKARLQRFGVVSESDKLKQRQERFADKSRVEELESLLLKQAINHLKGAESDGNKNDKFQNHDYGAEATATAS